MDNFDDTSILELESKLPKGNPFSVPEGYFSLQSEQIMNQISLEEKAGKELPWQTPDTYFETLSDRIEARTATKRQAVFANIQLRKWAYAAAASVIFCVGIFLNKSVKPPVTGDLPLIEADSLSTATILGTLSKSDITDEELLNHVDISDLSSQLTMDENIEQPLLDEIDELDLTQDM